MAPSSSTPASHSSGPACSGRLLTDGSLLIDVYEMRSCGNEYEFRAGRGQTPTFRAHGTVLHVSRDGEQVDTIVEVDGEENVKIGTPAPTSSVAPDHLPSPRAPDYVLALWKDELEVEHVRLFDLIR